MEIIKITDGGLREYTFRWSKEVGSRNVFECVRACCFQPDGSETSLPEYVGHLARLHSREPDWDGIEWVDGDPQEV